VVLNGRHYWQAAHPPRANNVTANGSQRAGALDNESPARTHIRAVVRAIEVGDKTVRIVGCKDVLQAVIAGKQTANEKVRKWRAIQNKAANSYVIEIAI
jgi:hypothetical protein